MGLLTINLHPVEADPPHFSINIAIGNPSYKTRNLPFPYENRQIYYYFI
jgi:hypothetical protein